MFRAGLILLFCALPSLAGEYAVMASGLRLHAERHELAGDVIRLYEKDGITEMPASAIVAFEQEDYVAPPPPPAPVVAEAEKPAGGIPTPAAAPKITDPKELIRAAAQRTGMPSKFETLVQSVAKVESAYDPHAVSPKGALGVMQLMPGTARKMGADPGDIEQNIDAGARLLKDLLAKYNGDVVKALAAYNAGEAAVDRYAGVPPYAETQQYVNKVVKDYIRNGGQ